MSQRGHQVSASEQAVASPVMLGVDADGEESTYADDAMAMQPLADVTDSAQSYERVAFEGFEEIAQGGNGTSGHDETSENIRATWRIATPSPGVTSVSDTR